MVCLISLFTSCAHVGVNTAPLKNFVHRFLLPCAIIVCNDIFAYFSGFFFGRKFINRPFIKLSPNKTWEGFIGATFWTILFAWLVCIPAVQLARHIQTNSCKWSIVNPHLFPLVRRFSVTKAMVYLSPGGA